MSREEERFTRPAAHHAWLLVNGEPFMAAWRILLWCEPWITFRITFFSARTINKRSAWQRKVFLPAWSLYPTAMWVQAVGKRPSPCRKPFLFIKTTVDISLDSQNFHHHDRNRGDVSCLYEPAAVSSFMVFDWRSHV